MTGIRQSNSCFHSPERRQTDMYIDLQTKIILYFKRECFYVR